MAKKVLFLSITLVLLLTILTGVQADDVEDMACVDLTGFDEYVVTQDTVLCPKTYSMKGTFNRRNWDYAIEINASDVVLDCNGATINGNGVGYVQGILLYDKKNVTIKDCNVKNYYYGINVHGNNTLIQNNTIYSNTKNGIYLWYNRTNAYAINNQVINNTVYDNDNGIYLDWGCKDTQMGGNIVKFNEYGIQIYKSSDNTIVSNIIIDNTVAGIKTSDYESTSSENNLIYNNYFAKNGVNVQDKWKNFWSISKTPGTNIVGGPYLGGNFWDDYAGEDNTEDDIGDTDLPYDSNGKILDGGDYLPLINTTSNEGQTTGLHLPVMGESAPPGIQEETSFFARLSTFLRGLFERRGNG